MDRTVTDVLTEHQRTRQGDGCLGEDCIWSPDDESSFPAHQSEMLTAAGLSRVLTDPERAALDRLREDANRPRYLLPEELTRLRTAVAAVVAVVERLAAAPAPEALVDAVARAQAIHVYDEATRTCGCGDRMHPDYAADHVARAVLAVVGQATTHDTDTDECPRCDDRADHPNGPCLGWYAASRAAATDGGEGR